MTILYEDLPVVYGTGEVLEDKTDWTTLKLKSFAVSKVMYSDSDYWIRRTVRMELCGSRLHFACSKSGEKRLVSAQFCRDRLCPACQKRRSLAVFHQVKSVCLSMQKQYKSTQYLLLTLTIPNVPIDRMADSIKMMNKSWQKMTNRVEFKKAIWGWFKTLEVTYNGKTDTYHPHFHVLLAVPGEYFKGKNYIRQDRWLELWQKSTGMPEITQVDVRKIKPNPKKENSTDIESAAAEVGKYATKPSNYIAKLPNGDYLACSKVVRDLSVCLHGVRLTAFGGRLRDHYKLLGLKDVEGDSVDLVNVSGESDLIDAVMIHVYDWNAGLKVYVG